MPRRNGAIRIMGDAGSRLAHGSNDYMLQGRQAIRRIDDCVEQMVRERPLTTIFAAVGFGIAIGMLLALACPASFPQLKGWT